MSFRRILAFVALAGLLGACTPEANPPQTTVGNPATAPRPSPLPGAIERETGPIYNSPKLQALVDRIGNRLVSQSNLVGTYRFYILDQPLPNAHAVSGGYVFVTRGLLAMVDDDAELAAAMSHELGHLTQRHAAQREKARKGVIDAAVQAAMTSGSIQVGRSVASSGLLELRRYSREQELEADRVGLSYLVKAGYRGDAMAGLIDKLRRQARLEDELLGVDERSGQTSTTSTHPAPDDRLAVVQALPTTRQPGQADRAGYLALIDGMSVDDAPEEGFVRGSRFLHPTMRLAFEAPSDFRLLNDHDGVFGFGRDRSAMNFSCSPDKVTGRLDDWMRNKLKPTPTDIEATTIGGMEAAIGARPRGADTGLAQVRYVLIRFGDGVCYFNLASDGPDRDRRIDVLINAARSFRALTPAEAAALKPYRLHIVPRGGGSAAQYALRLPYGDHKLARLLALNGVDNAAEFTQRSEIKLVEP